MDWRTRWRLCCAMMRPGWELVFLVPVAWTFADDWLAAAGLPPEAVEAFRTLQAEYDWADSPGWWLGALALGYVIRLFITAPAVFSRALGQVLHITEERGLYLTRVGGGAGAVARDVVFRAEFWFRSSSPARIDLRGQVRIRLSDTWNGSRDLSLPLEFRSGGSDGIVAELHLDPGNTLRRGVRARLRVAGKTEAERAQQLRSLERALYRSSIRLEFSDLRVPGSRPRVVHAFKSYDMPKDACRELDALADTGAKLAADMLARHKEAGITPGDIVREMQAWQNHTEQALRDAYCLSSNAPPPNPHTRSSGGLLDVWPPFVERRVECLRVASHAVAQETSAW